MGLHVCERDSGAPTESQQSADLIGHDIVDLVWTDGHHPSSETLFVGQSGVGTYADTGCGRRVHRFPHGAPVSGMKAASNVGRRDEAHAFGVLPKGVDPKAFTHVAIDVDDFMCHVSSP